MNSKRQYQVSPSTLVQFLFLHSQKSQSVKDGAISYKLQVVYEIEPLV